MTHKQATDIQVLTVERVLGEVLIVQLLRQWETALIANNYQHTHRLVGLIEELSTLW